MKNNIPFIIVLFTIIAASSCKKDPGSGGNSSVNGYVHLTVLNNSNTDDTLATQDASDADVYIIYGDDIAYGDRTRTNYDGRFEFKYLRKGKYKVFVYSKNYNFMSGFIRDSAIIKSIEITARKQSLDAGTLEIVKYQ